MSKISCVKKSDPLVTICVLTYGDHLRLAEKTIGSILRFCHTNLFRLVVGANAVSEVTLQYLRALHASGKIDSLYVSPRNINKCPMMRRMFENIATDFIWWFDDDSHIVQSNALEERVKIALQAPDTTVMWGHRFYFEKEIDFSYGTDILGFIKASSWYRGLRPPSLEPGGRGEFDFEGRCLGDGRWFFITGGCWFIRTKTIRTLDWPDRRLIKRSDDVLLCEAIRQQGLDTEDIGPLGVAINTEPRRGAGEDRFTMELQVGTPQARLD